MMPKGQSFLSEEEKTSRGLKRHLNIIITGQDVNSNYLVVPVTTWYEMLAHQDASCILEANCHSFIKHKSWVDYSRARQMSYIEVFNGIHKGLLIKKEDVTPVVLKKIQDGAQISPYLDDELFSFFAYF
jgi:hypothetical protein